jgi:hypothetical protein
MCRNVQTMLVARKFPIRIVYGPLFPTPEACSNGLVIIERDPDSDDVAQSSRQANTSKRAIRIMACRATVFGQSSVASARRNEHEHECETLVDGLHSALDIWCEGARSLPLQFGGGRYAKPGEINFVEKFSGVQYVFKFGVARSVDAREYEGLATAPVMRAAGAGNQVDIAANLNGPARSVTLPTS